MSTYVLVPGAWLGAWAWDTVAERLRRGGHDVHAVTLSGMAERQAEVNQETSPADHADQVAALLRDRDLRDVLLVGHSYAGLVVTGAAAREPDRVARLLYIDVGMPAAEDLPPPDDSGASAEDDDEDDEETAAYRALAESFDGWRVPLPPDEILRAVFGADDLGDDGLADLRARATPTPLTWLLAPLSRADLVAVAKIPRTLVRCTRSGAEPWWVAAAVDRGWSLEKMRAGHWPMLSQPGVLSEVLANPITVRPSAIDRYHPLWAADERTMLDVLLDFHRDAVVRKLEGLSVEQLVASPVGSGTSLLGIVRHLTGVEHGWFSEVFCGVDAQTDDAAPAAARDREDEWSCATVQSVDDVAAVLDAYRDVCALSRERVRGADLDQVARHPEATPTLRWVLLHMIEETARHAGHADILRELADGAVGE